MDGPWTYEVTDPVTNVVTQQPMPRGNYKLVVAGKRVDSADEIKNETPNEKVSIVVTKVAFEEVPAAPRLGANPKVDGLAGESSTRHVRLRMLPTPP